MHPNKFPFEGCLTKLDCPSDGIPNGSHGRRVILTAEAARDALDSLIGMAVGFAKGWDNHDMRQKCGVITDAWIDGDELRIRGHIFARDFPEVIYEMARPDVKLGLSYEMVNARVADMRAQIYTLIRVTFTGAGILLQNKAAYTTTSINLSASAAKTEEFTGALQFVDEGTVKLGREGRLQRWGRRLRNARGVH